MATSFGSDLYHLDKAPRNSTLEDFCSFMYSDLLSAKGLAAAATITVAAALGLTLPSSSGCVEYVGHRITLSASAYLQSDGEFNISEQKNPQFHLPGSTGNENICIFCLLACKDSSAADPTVLEQWKFYVLTHAPERDMLRLSEIEKSGAVEAEYETLRAVVDDLIKNG